MGVGPAATHNLYVDALRLGKRFKNWGCPLSAGHSSVLLQGWTAWQVSRVIVGQESPVFWTLWTFYGETALIFIYLSCGYNTCPNKQTDQDHATQPFVIHRLHLPPFGKHSQNSVFIWKSKSNRGLNSRWRPDRIKRDLWRGPCTLPFSGSTCGGEWHKLHHHQLEFWLHKKAIEKHNLNRKSETMDMAIGTAMFYEEK